MSDAAKNIDILATRYIIILIGRIIR